MQILICLRCDQYLEISNRLKQLFSPPVTQTYRNAVTTCNQNQGYLASTKTKEKMNLIQNFLTTDIQGIWIGLSDAVREGEYIWEEDGSFMTSGQLRELFYSPEPSDGGPKSSEDCGMVHTSFLGLNDAGCGQQYASICEMKLMVTME